MKITKHYLKKIIVESAKEAVAPSIINAGGELMEFEEYMNMLESMGLPRNPAIYLEKIGNLANMTPKEVGRLGMEVSDWKKANSVVIARERSKAQELLPQQKTALKPPEKKGMLGLGFLGLEEQKGENKMKITREYLRRVIKEELGRVLREGPEQGMRFILTQPIVLDASAGVRAGGATNVEKGVYIVAPDESPGAKGQVALYTVEGNPVGNSFSGDWFREQVSKRIFKKYEEGSTGVYY